MSVSFDKLQGLARAHLAQQQDDCPQEQIAATAETTLVRTEILRLTTKIGGLSASFLKDAPLDAPRPVLNELAETNGTTEQDHTSKSWTPSTETQQCMANVLWSLCVTSSACSLDLRSSVLKKMMLNERKYPVELCKGKAGKYTQYSESTGITKTEGQSTLLFSQQDFAQNTVQDVTNVIRRFATDRLWSRYHTPRNLLLALLGELGELAELYQWKGDDADGSSSANSALTEDELDKVSQELADVTIYLLRLADVCGVDIGTLALGIAQNLVKQTK